MKKLFILIFLITLSFTISAQEKSKWPKVDVSNLDAEYYPARAAWRNYLGEADRNINPKIKVLYSRPLKNDREIFGSLVPFGKVWRLGANEATEVTFYQAVGIGGKTVNRGTYTLSALVNEDSWTLRFSSQRGIWGVENADPEQIVAQISVPSINVDESQEMLSMTFTEQDDLTAHLVIQWDKTKVEVPITFNPIQYSPADVSPMDIAHYPSNSAFTNYLEGEEKNTKPKIQVVYSRPYKKGRKVFGELLKTGDIWRVGANQSTEISFYQDVKIADLELRRGKYALYAELKEGSWDFIFSTDIPAWGAANRDESKDVGRVNIPIKSEAEVLENLSIIFEEKNENLVHMIIGWDTTRAELPISMK